MPAIGIIQCWSDPGMTPVPCYQHQTCRHEWCFILSPLSLMSHEIKSFNCHNILLNWLVNTYLRSHHHPHMVHVIIMWQLVTTDHVSCSGRGHLRPIWTFHHSFSIKSASQRCLHARLIPQNSSHVTWKVIFSWNSHILSLMIIPVGRKCWAWWWYDTNSSSTRVWSIISLRPSIQGSTQHTKHTILFT